MTDALAIDLHPLATEGASGAGEAIDIGGQRSCLKLELIVDAMTASSLGVTIQHAPTSTGPWERLADLPTLTAAVTRDTVPLVLDARRFVRVTWAPVGGGASFHVFGEAHTLFAAPRDVLANTMPEKMGNGLAPATLATACLASTDEAATYLNSAFAAPIETWGAALTLHVSKMARYHSMDRRGYQPTGTDELIVKGYDDAIKWLTMVSLGKIKPPAIIGAQPTRSKNSARVTSRASNRGW